MGTWYSCGKLLLTGEYLLLNGAKGISLATQKGQWLQVEKTKGNLLILWESFDENLHIWYREEFKGEDFIPMLHPNAAPSKYIRSLLKAIYQKSTTFDKTTYRINTRLEFNQNWGLGSSSTLLVNLCKEFNVDAFAVHHKISSGSGFDVATALENGSILFSSVNKKPKWQKNSLSPIITPFLYFVYTGKKQDSQKEVENYNPSKNIHNNIKRINQITEAILTCEDVKIFKQLVKEHEQIVATEINKKTIKELLFSDFCGTVKSLGAWGGDFIMAVNEKNPTDYFKNKGFSNIYTYKEFIKIT